MFDLKSSDIYIKNIHSVSHDVKPHPWTHKHPDRELYEFFFQTKGECKLNTNNTNYTCNENDLIIVIPHTQYNSESLVYPTEITGVYFTAELPESNGENFFNSFHIIKNCNETIRKSFKTMNHLFLLKQPDWQLGIRKELYKVISIMLNKVRISSMNNYNYYIIKAADEYIKANYLKEDISIDYLASLCKITPSYFTRIFKDVFGTAPKKYIIDLKMQAACEYLHYTDTPIKEIATILGYTEFPYFTTSFKKHFGITPLEYRRNTGNSNLSLFP